ncbi:hypothetical protein LVD17_27245 [Fulvivirga ulvae]|uniref:hypothetical protein n=1 Tax=Fulvivirga ulvae TaxID=2904245 RepID=UPI001F190E69|nr:hypothetical protein [Fulvivirga ulvae]UII31988.1 hypothetical protein LVD17_27245 [Fulvivirga ulvae]
MMNIKNSLLIVFFLSLTTCTNGQKMNTCNTNLRNVYQFLKGIDYSYNVSDYRDFKGFDFNKFEPISGEINYDDYYRVGYDSNDEIVEINHYEKELILTNFRMPVYQSDSFIVFGYEGFWRDYDRKDEGHFNAGFFLHIKQNEKNYFINTLSQFSYNPDGKANFSGNFPIGEMDEISAILYLDDKLYPEKMIRISKGQIVMGSEFHYAKDFVVQYEILHVFNIPELNLDLQVSYETCIDDYQKLLNKRTFAVRVYPDVKKQNYALPFWIWAGAHDYVSKRDLPDY